MCQFFGLCLEIKQLTKYYMHYSISKMHVCMYYGWFVVVFSVRFKSTLFFLINSKKLNSSRCVPGEW